MQFLGEAAGRVTGNEDRSRIGLKLVPAAAALRVAGRNQLTDSLHRPSADRTKLASTVNAIIEDKRLPKCPSASGEIGGDTLTELSVAIGTSFLGLAPATRV